MTSTNKAPVTIDKDSVSKELNDIVAQFNESFNAWMLIHGCRAEFAWKYGTDRTQIKALEVMAVDLIVYRKPPPQFEVMREKLSSPS